MPQNGVISFCYIGEVHTFIQVTSITHQEAAPRTHRHRIHTYAHTFTAGHSITRNTCQRDNDSPQSHQPRGTIKYLDITCLCPADKGIQDCSCCGLNEVSLVEEAKPCVNKEPSRPEVIIKEDMATGALYYIMVNLTQKSSWMLKMM